MFKGRPGGAGDTPAPSITPDQRHRSAIRRTTARRLTAGPFRFPDTSASPARPALTPIGARTEYGLSTVGANGRLSDRSPLRRLGWHPGTRLDLHEDHGLIVVRADPRAAFRISGQGFLLLPCTLRRWCHLTDGDRVLLVADPHATRLVIHPPAAVTAMLDAAHTHAWGGEAR